MGKVTVHHAITGCEYSGGNGNRVTAHTLQGQRDPYITFTDCGAKGSGPVRLDGRLINIGLGGVALWAEAQAWNDDAPERKELRTDKRSGFTRAHVVLWPDEASANRLRHLVPFVDPLTLSERLDRAPLSVVLEDDPCPHCDGTGTRKEVAGI